MTELKSLIFVTDNKDIKFEKKDMVLICFAMVDSEYIKNKENKMKKYYLENQGELSEIFDNKLSLPIKDLFIHLKYKI